jgi:putative DNA primase/helicase
LLGELPGINRWALDGLRRLRANGRFTETDAGKDLANEFRRNNSDAFSFMQDFLVIRPELNPGNLTDVRTTTENIWITGDELRKAFARWCNDNGRMGSVNWIERNLRTLMPKLQNERKTVDGRKISIFPGIGLAS